MFSGEAKMSGASIEAIQDPSYELLGIDHTLFDPSRLVGFTRLRKSMRSLADLVIQAQVLINLLSNVGLPIIDP